MNIKHSIGLNLSADAIPGRLHMVQGDSNSRTIVATLWDGAQLYSIPAGAAVMVRFRKPDGTGGLYDTSESGQKVSYTGSIVTAPVATQMLAVAGDVFAEIDIFGSSSGAAAERLATFRFIVEVAPCVLPDAQIISSDYYNILASKVAEAVAAADRAEQAQSAAAASAEAAATSAANAAASVEGAVKYSTPQTLTDEQKQQARDNINAPAPYTAGENISISGSVIATKAFPCNPNLLDNWYFGNPVNQRNGYVVPPGVEYKDVNTGITVGTTTTYYAVIKFSNGNAIVEVDGLNRFVQPGGFVPGYMGVGYGIDRWAMWQAGGVVTVENGGIVIRKISGEYVQWGEKLETDVWGALVGRQVTMSALTVNGQLATTTQTFTEDGIATSAAFEGITFHSTGTLHMLDFVLTGTESPAIRAVKLELGTRQTIAHQENGVWVLNEIPDYGEQLRRCQRYFFRSNFGSVSPAGGAYISDSTSASTYLVDNYRFPVAMRTKPIVKILSLNGTEGKIGYWASAEDAPYTVGANIQTVGLCGFNAVESSASISPNIYAFHVEASADL